MNAVMALVLNLVRSQLPPDLVMGSFAEQEHVVIAQDRQDGIRIFVLRHLAGMVGGADAVGEEFQPLWEKAFEATAARSVFAFSDFAVLPQDFDLFELGVENPDDSRRFGDSP